MKKIININLYGRVIPIEDAAYDSLQRYIESLRRYFAAEEGRDEIINDIESRISELMNDRIKKGAPAVTEADMEEIIGAMGRVEDIAAAEESDGTSATGNASGASSASGGYQKSGSRKTSGRLYRNANDKFIGGVCSGIAAYTNIDPTVVRLLFAIVTFGGFGLGFLIYIVLWAVLPSNDIQGYTGKRFFRNPDDQVLGGVCGGLGAYFNKSTNAIRAVFAAPLLLNFFLSAVNGIFNIGDFDFGPVDIAFGSLTSTFVIAYIVLWIVLPLARTPYDKMEMRGEKVDVARIRQNVQQGMGDFKSRARDFGEEVRATAQNLSSRFSDFDRSTGRAFAGDVAYTARRAGSGIGHAIGVLFKAFFLFIAGVIAFALFVVVLVFVFGGVFKPVNAFLLDGTWQQAFMWGTVLFFLAVPLLAIITWIIRRALKVRSQNRYLGWTFGGLWALGWVCLTLFVSSLVKDFRFMERTETPVTLAQPQGRKLIVQVPGVAVRYSGSFSWLNDDDEDGGWDINEDSLKLSTIRISVKPSTDSSYHVTTYKYAQGVNRATALGRAEKVNYSVSSIDSVLQLGSGFGLGRGDKYRNQRVLVEIAVPVGRQIRFASSVGEKLNPYDIRVAQTLNNGQWRRNWNRRRYEFEWDNNWHYDWKPDTDYYMTASGELKGAGVPETEPARGEDGERDANGDSTNRVRDSLLQEYRRKIDSVERIGAVTKDEAATEGLAATTRAAVRHKATPMPMPFVPTLF